MVKQLWNALEEWKKKGSLNNMWEFVIWMLGFPLSLYVADILCIFRNKLLGYEQLSRDEYKSASKTGAIMWIVIGILLYIK
jgi:hypothetical protein